MLQMLLYVYMVHMYKAQQVVLVMGHFFVKLIRTNVHMHVLMDPLKLDSDINQITGF